MNQHYLKCLVRAILAGMMIGIGGCVYLGCDVKWVGAILFAVGLFTIFSFRLDLYTGKVGYVFDNKPPYLIYLLVVIIGNFIGCLILGLMMPLDAASVLAERKLADYDFLRVLFKGVLCGMLMFIAADCYKNTKSFIATFVCVPVFILARFEHSIADMFYFCSAGAFSVESLVFIITVLIGNAIGGFLIPVCRKWMYEDEAPKAS